MRHTFPLSIVLLSIWICWSNPLQAETELAGLWGGKYGDMQVTVDGTAVTGTLVNTSKFCPFENGRTLFKGTRKGDLLTGQFLMCQADDDCGPPVWAQALLLIGKNATVLSGSATAKATCPLVGFSKSENGEKGLYFKRLQQKKLEPSNPKMSSASNKAPSVQEPEKVKPKAKPAPLLPGPPAPPGTYDPRAAIKASDSITQLLFKGKQALVAGRFEAARQAFEKILKKDPGHPAALVGTGVSHYGRNERDVAMTYYKQALSEDPNFGMAYYNLACLYALAKDPETAMEYLKIAYLNGFVEPAAMLEDPDLAMLRDRPDFKALVQSDY